VIGLLVLGMAGIAHATLVAIITEPTFWLMPGIRLCMILVISALILPVPVFTGQKCMTIQIKIERNVKCVKF